VQSTVAAAGGGAVAGAAAGGWGTTASETSARATAVRLSDIARAVPRVLAEKDRDERGAKIIGLSRDSLFRRFLS